MHFRPQRHKDDDMRPLVFMIVLTIILTVVLFVPFVRAGGSLPVVEEHYDAVVIVHLENCDLRKVVFIRGDRIIAERMLIDEMLWTTDGEDFLLVWDDYHLARRRISFETLSEIESPQNKEQPIEWFNQFRIMTNLKAPE